MTAPRTLGEIADQLDALRLCLRDLIATIELMTDCMTNTIDRATLDPYIERADGLLGETVEEILEEILE
ncbi:MAG: hypothetical protein A3H93_09115 [Rhodocyclales bacterium RIFCSPLOWO2_02_FULL_63_24]|nr:MAG: hypothetical protein A3H93_09115 [Rhodocyclales bacterium RIFCSPLOWO2_02_FULL_63_24]